MHFTEFPLDERLLRQTRAAGYTDMTPIQEAAIPPALAGRDLVGIAQTGTGKTAAFALPLLQRLLEKPTSKRRIRALVVTPTRELAEQVYSSIRQLAASTKIQCATVYGGVGFDPQKRALLKGTDIIVACPGRLLDHIGRGQADLGGVEVLILDEADRMLDMGFLPSVRQIVRQLPRERQTMLFSATFAPELNRFAADILRDPERVEIGLAAPADTVEHKLCPVEQQRKTDLLLRLLRDSDTRSVLIFTRTKHRADKVATQVQKSGYRATALHSNKSQGQRQKALDGFRSGRYQLLVATDIAARGLDIAGISHVINYDIPSTADDYIHRIGRTGRAEHSGSALTLVTHEDRRAVRDIERALGESLEIRQIEGFDAGFDILPAARPQRKSRIGAAPAAKTTERAPTHPARRRPRRRVAQSQGEQKAAS